MEPTLSSLIDAAEGGDQSATDALFATLYAELRRMAKRELGRRGVPMSLGATTLLHQAYIEIAEKDGVSFPDRGRFMAYAARVMRGLIIDHARSEEQNRRGNAARSDRGGGSAVQRVVDYGATGDGVWAGSVWSARERDATGELRAEHRS